jgi:tRNA 2-thiouridine synthesizing protein B
MERSQNCVLFLAADGVYNLLEAAFLLALPKKRVLACKEDLKARGVQVKEGAIVPENFYEQLAKDMISEDSRIYAF